MNAKWKWVAVAVASGALGALGALALGHGRAPAGEADEPQPVAKEKSAEWIPKKVPKGDFTKFPEGYHAPTAFPELAVVGPDPTDPKFEEKREEQFAKLCPRFAGKVLITIEPTDGTYQKLHKARLYYGLVYIATTRKVIRIGKWAPQDFVATLVALANMEAACQDLWGGQPKALVPWLEELVVVAKEVEQFTSRRVTEGIDPPQNLSQATAHRLRAEAALWKAKNPK
jgi:hypothetical protein